MFVRKKVTDLVHGDEVLGFGKVYHVWYKHHKICAGVLGRKARSYHVDQKVLVDIGYVGSLGPLPKIESELAFRNRVWTMWNEEISS